MNTEILAIGTELLLGNVVNTDATDISRALSEIGVNVFWHTVVGDNPARITECVYRAKNRADLIITTGGLGPTCDDISREVLCKAFNREMVYNESAEQSIRAYFKERGQGDFTENNKRQAWLPRDCEILPNDCGTAPGCVFEEDGVKVVMLPGPPRECLTMFRKYAMPWLQKLSGEVIRSHMIHMFGIGESSMETRLRDLMDGANPTVAPYIREGECMVRVTAKAASEEECDALMEPVIDDIRLRMKDLIYGIDCDSLEEKVLELLKKKHKTLSTAESCTGGLLAKRLSDIPGASESFLGGTVVYTEMAKEELLGIDQDYIAEYGVVSSEVAGKMARRVRKTLNTDIGIGITGWAGPTGENVGLVYIGLAGKGECFTRRLQLGASTPRGKIRQIAASNALDMIRRYLSGLDV